MRRPLAALALALALATPAAAQTAAAEPQATAEARALVLAAGLADQLRESLPSIAEGLRAHLAERNPGREADVAHAVETAILPAVTRRLDELIDVAVQPLVRGFTLEELTVMRRFLELNLDQRMEGALALVSFELDRESRDWLRRVAEEALAAQGGDRRLRGLRY